MENTQTITLCRKNSVEEMPIEEFARWACLVEGMGKVAEKLDEANVDHNTSKWIKPLAFQKYIEERYPAMLADVKVEAAFGNI